VEEAAEGGGTALKAAVVVLAVAVGVPLTAAAEDVDGE
jgi:hypothetical protein